jgi:hypothetical protein
VTLSGEDVVQVAAVAAAVGLGGIAVFQLALALGAPLGRAAWGGNHHRLPTRLRVGSAVATIVWVVAAIIVLSRVGLGVSLPDELARWGTWILVGLLVVGAAMNFLSRSKWERFLWGPAALVLAGLCLVVALGASNV